MDYQQNDHQTDVPNDSERIRNESEPEQKRSEPVPNNAERVPNKVSVRSEPVPIITREKFESEQLQSGNVPNGSDRIPNSVGSVPNNEIRRSEQAQNDSELVRKNQPEQFRTAPMCSQEHDEFTITVREAARIFEEAGVPRTERAITKWCNRNARGITRLDCCYSESERKYFIAPESIERVSIEERRKFQYIEYQNGGVLSAKAEDLSEQLRNENAKEQLKQEGGNTTKRELHENETRSERVENEGGYERVWRDDGHAGTHDAEKVTGDEATKLKELQMQNYDLRVQLEGQKFLVRKFDELVDGERERHEKEKMALVDRLTDARYQIGTLEQKLLRLEAPRESVRDAETKAWREVSHTSESERPDVR